jgi:hypothetical protein
MGDRQAGPVLRRLSKAHRDAIGLARHGGIEGAIAKVVPGLH